MRERAEEYGPPVVAIHFARAQRQLRKQEQDFQGRLNYPHMVMVDDALRSELEKDLTEDEIAGFGEGDLAIFIDEPKYMFFRATDDRYQHADVVQDRSPDMDAAMRIYHDVHWTSLGSLLDKIRNAGDLNTYPVELGFGELVEEE